MTRRRRTVTASTWVLWSSPLLLIVLVLSVGASRGTGSPAPPSGTAPPGARRTSVSHPATTVTTTRDPTTPATGGLARRVHPPATPTTTTTSTTTTTATATSGATAVATPRTGTASAPAGSTGASSAAGSSSSTGSSPDGSGAASATSGPVAGRLGGASTSATVPLAGPANWTLASSGPLTATLSCGGEATTVEGTFAVGTASCQLTLSDPTTAPVAWQASPGP